MEQGDIFDKRYELERRLGGGGYSEVWLAKDTKTEVEVALKIFAPSTGLDSSGLDMFAREFSLVADVNDSCILKPLYFESEQKPYLVLQYCKQGSLENKIGKITEQEAWQILHDVAKGLKALHSHTPNPIIHQDIKPENILISDDGHYMITDFGVSVRLRRTIQQTMSMSLSSAGTQAYMASERFSRNRLRPIMPSDVWSLGAMVFELLTGEVPFGEKGGWNQEHLGLEVPEMPGEHSSDLRDIIERCLAEKPSERPFVEEIERIAEEKLNSLETGNESKSYSPQKNEEREQNKEHIISIKFILITAASIVLGLVLGNLLGIVIK